MIKHHIYIAILLVVVSLSAVANSVDCKESVQKAATAYQHAQYDQAVKYYQECLDKGVRDPRIYYNLGNAYFKMGQLGESILNYERASLLNPSDEQIQHNLNVARARTRDRVDPIPLLFIVQWWNNLKDNHSVDTLFTVSTVIAWVFAGIVFLFFGFRNVLLRRFALGFGIVIFGLLIASIVLVQDKKEDMNAHRYGIVLSIEASVSSAPDKSGVDAFIVHEGLKVEILAKKGERMKIRLADGKEGWIDEASLNRI